MKLYVSSYRLPTPNDLAELLGKPLAQASMALITNAQDYYAERARAFKVNDATTYMQQKGLAVEEVDLRNYSDAQALKAKLSTFDIIWAMGGNTFNLRYEMQRSGFETIIAELLEQGKVYGGDSAGALVAGVAINGIESADEPAFAPNVIAEGLHLVPFAILPHVDNPEFAQAASVFKDVHKDASIIELKDSQAVIFTDNEHRIVEGIAEI